VVMGRSKRLACGRAFRMPHHAGIAVDRVVAAGSG
jgi:hypothetical protein